MEACQTFGWPYAGIGQRLRSHPADISNLHRFRLALDEIIAVGAYVEPKNERQTLDVFAPSEGKNHPVIVWIRGGGWTKGRKNGIQKKPEAFTERGFVFVPINYRFVPNVTVKEMTGDIAKASHWVPVDVQHVLAAIVLAARNGELDPNIKLSPNDPALAAVLASHVKTVFEKFGGKLGSDD